jgi:hypothetical protein
MPMSKELENLDDVLKGVDLSDKTEMGEVTKEFSENKPSSSNLTSDEQKIIWRLQFILGVVSPQNLKLINNYIDSRRSVAGWNTEMKVQAISGIQQQRSGGMLSNAWNKLMTPRNPQ